MENALTWGMEWIIALQAVGGSFAEPFFEAITFMGEEYFYLILVPIIFWSIDPAAGARVGFAFLITAYVNPILKFWFPEPRPYQIDASVSETTVPGSGMPSGHAQSSIFVWGVLAAQVKRRWFWGLVLFIAFLVGFSRVYLGVHFPHQVLAGWLVGGVLLVLFLKLDPIVERTVAGLELAPQLLLSIGVPVVLALIFPHNDTVGSAAVMAGFGSGLVLCHRFVPFSAAGFWWQRVLRSVVGLAIMLGLYFGLSALFPREESGQITYFGFRFIRYGILGLWIGFGAPWFFSIARLTEEQTPTLRSKHA